jgi:aminopeptidase YwaD
MPGTVKSRNGSLTASKQLMKPEFRNHVKSFCEIGPRCDEFPSSIHGTLAYLKVALIEYGYDVQEEQTDSKYQSNVIAELPGTMAANCVFEIGAHYDTRPNTPGADDNASGLAGLLEIARALAGVKCRRTIRFCFFGMEETTRGGSRSHVTQLMSRRNEDVAGALALK